MTFQGNWIDLVILLILAYLLFGAWRAGVWIVLADFLSFAFSLIISLKLYPGAAALLRANFSLSHSVANALGFIFVAMISEAIIGVILARAIRTIPERYKKSKFGKVAALIPSLGQGFILLAFILTIIMAFPVAPSVKKDISESRIGSGILRYTTVFEKTLADIFGGVIQDSLTYFTVRPQSNESIPLDIEIQELKVDEQAERELFTLVNKERSQRGLSSLIWAEQIVPVSRAHAKDMWERKYFSHVSPEGEDVGDRLADAQISYTLAGENLALAPTTQTAHTGLMNSDGHRANILEPNFKKIAIGVIDNGYYGKMFVQVFTD